jgi:hypothetical protein
MDKFYVLYEVEGFGAQQAGPYSQADVQSQRDDIAGFEGVCNVRVVSEKEFWEKYTGVKR